MNISILPEICNTGFQPVPEATGLFADNEFQARWQQPGQPTPAQPGRLSH
jgi:hypothetical protein